MVDIPRKLLRYRNRIISFALIVVGLYWFGNALPDQDWLWFLPVFNEEPVRIHLYRDGEQIVLLPDDPGYDMINEAINHAVRQVRAKKSLGILPESLEELYERFSAVEVFYTEPVIIHTKHGFPKANKYLFPQSGHRFDPPMVFAGMQREPYYRAGALVLASRDRLDEAVQAVWEEYGGN